MQEKEGMQTPMRKNIHVSFHVRKSLKWYDLNGNRNATFFVKFFIVEILEEPLSGASAHRDEGKGGRKEPLRTDADKLQRLLSPTSREYALRVCSH